MNSSRKLVRVIPSVPTSDGAGVKLRRSIGSERGQYLDPFLMLDEFGTDNPGDYIAGFPAHPHRGFETITYMLDGRMQHQDHLGNVGDLGPGSVQWMTAGRGVIHSEMPLQQEGRMRGFQLWLNLPAKEKLKPAWYADIPPERIASAPLPRGGVVKVIAGVLKLGDVVVQGPIHTPAQPVTTEPLYVDVHLPADASVSLPVPVAHTALIYAYEGQVTVGDRALPRQAAGVLGDEGDHVEVVAGAEGARFLLLAGKALGEPIVQYGPFVMNTRDEIETAIRDYQEGKLTAIT